MANSISINPMLTTVYSGGFSTTANGLVQGAVMDDPAVRFAMAGGVLSASEIYPMWGGVGIYGNMASTYSSPIMDQGPTVGRATTLSANTNGQLIGFSTFNQATAWVSTPQSPVPTASAYMTVPYYPLGSGARIAVACDPSLASSLLGGNIAKQVSWDLNNQVLQPYTGTSTYSVTSMTWSSINGGQVAVVMAAPSPVGAVGDVINISGATNSGIGGTALINTNQVVNTWTDNQHFTFLLPGTAAQYGTLGGTIVLNYDPGALPCKILRVQSGNSKTVVWDPVNNIATWNNSGTAALIQI